MRNKLLSLLFVLIAAALLASPATAARKTSTSGKKKNATKANTVKTISAPRTKTVKAAAEDEPPAVHKAEGRIISVDAAPEPDPTPAPRRRKRAASSEKTTEPVEEAARQSDLATTNATPLELFKNGDAYRQAGNYLKAEECFKQAWLREQRKPSLDPLTYRRLAIFVAIAYQNSMDFDQAADLLRAAITKDPRYPLYHYFMATSLAFISQQQKQAEPAEDGGQADDVPAAAAPGEKKTYRTRVKSEDIFEHLRLAYQLAANLNPGEKIPNPRTDVFLAGLRHDPRFAAVLAGAGPAATPDLEADLTELVQAGEDVSPDTQAAIAEEIEAHPTQAADLLLKKVADTARPEHERVIYIWALGRTRDPRAADTLAHILYQPGMESLKGAILEALSRIGGPKAGDALVLELRDAKEDTDRFQVLAMLANMQYAPALPLMLDLLKMDTEQAANQMLFCFGKMGEPAMPLLLAKMASTDKNEQVNAINMLRWIGSSRSMIPLQKRLAEEKDPEVRLTLLGAIDALMRPDQFEPFLKAALAKETDKDARGTMREKMSEIQDKKEAFEAFQKAKVTSRTRYRNAYDALYKSYGRAGAAAIEDLACASTAADEPELVKLRARILDRQSPECFADYMKITRMIAFNKMLGN